MISFSCFLVIIAKYTFRFKKIKKRKKETKRTKNKNEEEEEEEENESRCLDLLLLHQCVLWEQARRLTHT